MNKLISYIALRFILFYQKWISPHKGFCCAYKYKTGGHSCSQYAAKIVRRMGVLGLIRGLPKQFGRCRSAFIDLQREQERRKEEERKRKKQNESFCTACDCSLPDFGSCSGSDVGTGGGSSCDINLDCGGLEVCSAPFEACSCLPSGRLKPLWKKVK